jgi:hypothetical protein
MATSSDELALALEVDRDYQFADLFCVAADDSEGFASLDGARKALEAARVNHGIDAEKIRQALEKLPDLEIGTQIRIAEATPPTKSEDGRVDFHVDVSGQAAYRASDADDDQVDFKTATSVVCVQEGDLLAELIPPVQGELGTDIRGQPIAPRNPRTPSLVAGQNVEYDESARTFVARSAGRPVYSKGVLSVLPVYEVAGNVCYDTGHVEFNGSVIVHGNVEDDFNVTAKDILVHGNVGASQLTAKQSITVNSGVNGRQRAILRAGQNIAARYVNGSRLECLGDVTVEREIVNSDVLCNGRLRVGTLIGGNASARGGVEANVLGSDMGVATRVEPGEDMQVRKIEDALDVVDGKIEKLLHPIRNVLGDRSKFRAMPEEKQKAVEASHEAFLRLKEAHEKLANRRIDLMEMEGAEPDKTVVVRKQLNPDTIVRTEICMRNFPKEATGPLVIVEDIDRSTMVTQPYRAKGDPKRKDS